MPFKNKLGGAQATITQWLQGRARWVPRRANTRPQQRKRQKKGDKTTLDVPAGLYKAAKLAGQVKTAVRAIQGNTTRTAMAETAGICQESFSSFVRKTVPRHLTQSLKAIPQRTYTVNESLQLAVRDGAQEFNPVVEMNNMADLVLLPQLMGAVAGAKGVYIGGKVQFMITNHSSGTQVCMLYVMTPRQKLSTTPLASFSGGVALSSLADGYAEFGMRPGDSPYFREQWNVLKVIKFCLGPGETHIHYHDYNVDQLFDDQVESFEVNSYDPNWSVCFSLLSHGVAATSATGGPDTTTAGGQFNVVWAKKHRMKFFDLAGGVEDVIQATPGLPAKGTITERLYPEEGTAAANVNTGD